MQATSSGRSKQRVSVMGQSLRTEQICVGWIRRPDCRKPVANPPTHFLGSDCLTVHLLLSLTVKSVTVSSAFLSGRKRGA